jgi:hypothetical protein
MAAFHFTERDGNAIAELVECRQDRRCVLQLPTAPQRRNRQRALGALAPDEVPLTLARVEAEVAAQQLQLGTNRLRVIEQALRWVVVAENRGPPGAEDAGLLEADGLAVVAEEGLVVEIDTRDDGDIRIDHVHGVEAAAEADLEDRDIELRFGEEGECRERAEFEIRERDIATRALHLLERCGERFVARLGTTNTNALVIAEQVRRGVEADLVAGFEEDLLGERAGGTLAVGAADGEGGG